MVSSEEFLTFLIIFTTLGMSGMRTFLNTLLHIDVNSSILFYVMAGLLFNHFFFQRKDTGIVKKGTAVLHIKMLWPTMYT